LVNSGLCNSGYITSLKSLMHAYTHNSNKLQFSNTQVCFGIKLM